jgi:hypothetical protein
MSRTFCTSTSREYSGRRRSNGPVRRAIASVTTIPARMATSIDHAIHRFSPVPSPAAATISGEGVSPAANTAASGSPPGKAAATARADPGRRDGSGSRQRRSAASIAGSIVLTTADGAVRSPVSYCATRSPTVFATNARRPVNSSYITRPSAKMSLRAVASRPSSCSGAMYAGVPARTSSTRPAAASPKSMMRTRPCASSITFAGLRSR